MSAWSAPPFARSTTNRSSCRINPSGARSSPTQPYDDRRVDLIFGIGYDDDIEKAQGILEQLVDGHERILKTPEPVIKVHELADSSVNFICRPWAKTDDYWDVYWDLTRQVKESFDSNGISIPYPQQDVHYTGGG